MAFLDPSPQTKFVIDALGGPKAVRPSGEGWTARCPAHKDSNPSLSISQGDDGRTLLNCHKGCQLKDIVDALDLDIADLFPSKDPEEVPQKKLEAKYDYVDENGKLIFQVLRFRLPDRRKDFRQRRPDGVGGWIYATTGIRKPLYHLPEVIAARDAGKTIWVVEGEKDADNLRERGYPATTNPGGAGRWLPEHTEVLAGAHVVIVVDDDAVGRRHARKVYDELIASGSEVTVYAPPEGIKDVSDLLEAEDSLEHLRPFDMSQVPDPVGDLVRDIMEIGRGNDDDDKKLAKVAGLVARMSLPEDTPRGRLVRWDEFLAEPVPEYEWVIPGLLEVQERVMVVAAEGVGKTMLARQVAMMSAAGLHPFKRDEMPPIRTLTFDLENPERIIRRTAKRIHESLELAGRHIKDRAHLVVKPDGMNLLKEEDRMVVEDYVSRLEPQLLLLGPIYKSFIDPGGRTAESITTEVAMFFDHIRSTYGCALWLEHHAPLGSSMSSRDLRPFGSAVWSRWSEFGMSIKPDPIEPHSYDVLHYRGMRDEREWPMKMQRGDMWPFVVTQWMPSPLPPRSVKPTSGLQPPPDTPDPF